MPRISEPARSDSSCPAMPLTLAAAAVFESMASVKGDSFWEYKVPETVVANINPKIKVLLFIVVLFEMYVVLIPGYRTVVMQDDVFVGPFTRIVVSGTV